MLDLERCLAATEDHPTHIVLIPHLDGRIAVEHHDGPVFERNAAHLAMIGRNSPGEMVIGHRAADSGECHRRCHRVATPRPLSDGRSEEHTSELQSLMRISYAVFCLKNKKYRL